MRDNLHVNITNLHLRLRSVSFIRLVCVYVCMCTDTLENRRNLLNRVYEVIKLPPEVCNSFTFSLILFFFFFVVKFTSREISRHGVCVFFFFFFRD